MPSKGQRLDSLKAQRETATLTIDGLAKKAGLSAYYVQQLEVGGNCEVRESQQIADALGVSLATLGKKDL